ncbi:DUF3015 family protein [Trichloromonas sp.]|uniref:DUF3015 family protein n=1 Tax=Trichloromonas sp. TaxID=3069249 RepID=UPI002A49520C|nr:DUF3015 family protein [Trichloromonas sp.]
MRAKIVPVSLVIMVLLTASAWAGQAKTNCGCGLGTILWGDRADGSILSQSMQVSTNGILGNQTFGITSGTLGCEQPTNIGSDDQLFAYIRDNIDGLAQDMAYGEGEHLDTLAELMTVPAEERTLFAGKLQAAFGDIFITGTEDPGLVLERIRIIGG